MSPVPTRKANVDVWVRGRGRGHRRAFSLIEVLISGSLFLVGIAAVFSSYATAVRLQAHSHHMTRAIIAAEATLEELIYAYSTSGLLVVGEHNVPRRYDEVGRRTDDGRYAVTWVVRPFKVDEVREVEVKVTWDEGGTSRALRLKTWRY
jgi:type II secretory pathway pseudopilin PulG